MKRTVGVLIGAMILLSPAAAQAQSVSGTWTTRLWTSERAGVEMVQLQMDIDRSGRGRWNMGTSVALAALRGLSREQAAGSASDVRFEMVREAGTVAFTGNIRDGRGSGTFSFTASPEYAQRMAALGFSDLDSPELFSCAIHDVTTAYVGELRDLGYRDLDEDELMSFAIHGVQPQFIRDLNALGYEDIDADELVTMRIHGITPEWVRGIREALGTS